MFHNMMCGGEVMAETAELVFFDTFSHESSEEINLDLVQFPNIIYISEVRIIPLGARVQADFPGGVRLGATNPSQFDIEFFVNDLGTPGACTFESIGGFEYKQNGSIHLECKRKVPTDGLVLRGWYTTITLAVYGIPRDAMQEQAKSVNAHSHSNLTLPLSSEALPPPEAVAASAATQEWVQQHAQVAEAERAYMVEASHSGDPYNNSTYQNDQHQPVPHGSASGDYSSGRNYHEEWNHQTNHGPSSSRAGLHSGGGNISNDNYDGPKDSQRPYDSDPLPWEGTSTRSDRDWERDRDRKDRDRDRDRERERDRDRDREHDRDRLRDRGRDRDRDAYSTERSRDRSRDRSADRDWDDRRRDDRDRNRDKARDRSNSGSRDYNRAVSRDRDRDRESDGKRRGGEWPSRRERDHNRAGNSWGDRSPDRPSYAGHRDRKQRDGSWDRERDRERGSHHGGDWEERDEQASRKRPRTPPNPPHVPHKRPHTPPEDKATSLPLPAAQSKKDASPPPPVQFGSISPGDVESISEGEIPEADPDAEMESTLACDDDLNTSVMLPTLDGDAALDGALGDTGHDPNVEGPINTPIQDEICKDDSIGSVMRPLSVDPVDDARAREAAANLALLAAGGDTSVLAAAVAAAAAATRPAVQATPSPLASPAASGSSTASGTASAPRAQGLPSALSAAKVASVAAATPTRTASPVPPANSCLAPATPPAPANPGSAPSAPAPASASAPAPASASAPAAAPPALSSGPKVPSIAGSPLNHDEASLDGEQFEPILSDEEIEDDGQDMDFFTEESEELNKSFNPFQFEPQPLVYLKDPSISPCEAQFIRRHEKQLKKEKHKEKHPNQNSNNVEPSESTPDETIRLEEIVLQFEDVIGKKEVRESWVHAAEQACNLILTGLPYCRNRSEIIKCLMSWVRVGLDFKMAVRQPQPGYKVRHIKVGVRLAEVLCICSGAVAELLITNERIHQRLFHLYHQDCMSLSIKLMIIRALDASLRNSLSVEHFLKVKFAIPRGYHIKLTDRLKSKAEENEASILSKDKKSTLDSEENGVKVRKSETYQENNGEVDSISHRSSEEGQTKVEYQTRECNDEKKELEIKAETVKEEKEAANISQQKTKKAVDEMEDKDIMNEVNVNIDEKMEVEKETDGQKEFPHQMDEAVVSHNVESEGSDNIESVESSGRNVGLSYNAVKRNTEKIKDRPTLQAKKKVKIQSKKIIVILDGKRLVRVVKKRVSLNGTHTYDELNGYQTLLFMFKAEKLSRTKFALCNLIRKLHFYEVVGKFKNTVKFLVRSNHESCVNSKAANNELPVAAYSYLKCVVDFPHLNNTELDVTDTLVACLTEITSVFQQAPIMLAQPKRFLPGHAQFDLGACNQESQRPYLALFSFLHCHNFLECCNLLLTLPQTMNCNVVLGPLFNLIKALAESQEGLQYMATHVDATNLMLRILHQQPTNDELQDESTLSTSSSQYLGVCIAYRLQVLHFMDQIMDATSSGCFDPEHQETFESLLGLYYLGFSNIGRSSLVHVLSKFDFMKVLLNLLDYCSPDTDIKYRKYPGKNFVDDLIITAVKFCDSGIFLQKFGIPILKAAKNSNTKLQEVLSYLQIIESRSVFCYDDISALCDIIKKYIEQAASLPGELITALRVLKHLAVPSQGAETMLDKNANYQYSFLELKHKYVILELFSLDGVSHMTAILSRICEAFEQPALYTGVFLGPRGALIMSMILPSLELLRQMLTLTIQCRNTDFRDLTAINVLLQTFTLLNAFPSNAFASEAAQRGSKEVIETLLAYTQPVQPESSSEKEGLNNSLWTLMIAEVLKYVTTNAHTFMSGLFLLSELLPLPLPVQTRSSLPDDEMAQTVCSRKLWSAHLHSQSATIGDLISTLCGSSCPALLQLLRRVCVQLSDLAAPTALVVSRSVMDGILISLNIPTKTQSNNSASVPCEGPCSSHTARLLNFLACLITHASVKCAVLNLLCAGGRGSGVKADERFPQLVTHLCQILRSPYDSASHIQAQECVVSVMQSLCDVDITVMTPPASGSDSPISYQQFLASALPPRELLSLFCSVLLEHMSITQHSFTTLLPTVRTFLMLVEHDYGFYHLKSCLFKKTDALWHLFTKFCSSFTKDSSDLLSTLSTSLELLRVCLTPEGEYSDFETISSRIKAVSKPNGSPLSTGPPKDSEPFKSEAEPMETDAAVSNCSPEQPPTSVKLEPGSNPEIMDTSEEVGDEQALSKKMDTNAEQHHLNEFQNSLPGVTNHPNPHPIPPTFSKPHNDMESSSNLAMPSRKLLLSVPELAIVLGWHRTDLPVHSETPEKVEGSHKRHPIYHLEKLLRECCVEEETLESLHENVLGLIHILDDEANSPEHKACDAIEVTLPPSETLLTQFGHRPVFTTCEPDDDRLSQSYWLSVPASDEADQDMEQVTCDLLDFTREYIPDFHLLSDSVRFYRLRAGLGDDVDMDRADIESTKKRATGEDSKYLSTELKTRRPFVTPMRGRGFSRPVPQRGDLFRSRPPNTSRPPSLHVDDFVALETCGAQPTGPTGYNKLSMRAAKDIMATRSRGRGRGFGSDRGRFFGSGHQYRREGGLRVSNVRGDGPASWGGPPHEGQGQMAGVGPQRPFRSVDRVMREEKFGSPLAGRLGGAAGAWPGGKERDRFSGPGPMGRGGGGNSRRDPGRHQRTFTR